MTARMIKLSSILVVAIMAFLAFAAPARADRCDDLAKQLSDQIPGLKIGATRAGEIALTHPAVTRASLGCSGRNFSNSVSATTDKRKPAPDYYEFLAKASALVFTVTIDDTLRGVQRCVSRTNIFRGYDLDSRYRKLGIHCSVAKTGVKITVSRDKDA